MRAATNLRRGRLVTATVVLAASVAGVLGVVDIAVNGVQDWGLVAGFTALVFVGELLRVNLRGDREAAPVGAAGALGFALLTKVNETEPALHEVGSVVAVGFVGATAAALVYLALDRDPRLPDMASRLLGIGTVAFVFREAISERVAYAGLGRDSFPLVGMAIAVLAGGITDSVVRAGVRSVREQVDFRSRWRNEIQAQAPIGTAMAATGMLIALSVPAMGPWALLAFVVPLLVTQVSFRRYASINATYRQTIRALSRMTEVAGQVEPGHSRRVMGLSVEVGRTLGMNDMELLDLEYAALMHDIGQIALSEPIPRGATVAVSPAERRRIAELGAEVIRSTKTLDRVADIVAAQAMPYRRMREAGESDVPLPARIVKVVGAYDDLVTASHEERGRRAAWDALERLRRDMAYEYDPHVIEVLTRVLLQRGDI